MTRSEFQKEVHDYFSETWQPAWLYCQKLNEKLEGRDAVVVKLGDKYGLMVRSAVEMLGFPFVGTDNIMDAIRVFGGPK